MKLRLVSMSAPVRIGALPCLVCVCLLMGLEPVAAYRPFDGTDAAVADNDLAALQGYLGPHRSGCWHPVQSPAQRRLSHHPHQSAREQPRALEVREGEALIG